MVVVSPCFWQIRNFPNGNGNVPSLWLEPGDAVTLSEEATDTGMKNPAEIPPNSNKNWSSSQQFSPKKRFFALFQQNNVEKNSLKTGI